MIIDSAFSLSCSGRDDILSLPFFSAGRPLVQDSSQNLHPKCHLTTINAGSMRFRWNEENPTRKNFLLQQNIISPTTGAATSPSPLVPPSGYPQILALSQKLSVPVELIHSQVVYAIEQGMEGLPQLLARRGSHPDAMDLWRGDGLITTNSNLVPVVTVADCLPIYLYDPKTACRGVVHSGWKGTGIVREAIKLAEKEFGARAFDFSVVIGPHIHSCCYQVEQERLEFFTSNFGKSCILPPNNLNLAQANCNLLVDLGVPEDNILCCSDCTCCDSRFGSFRRQASHLPDSMSLEEKLRHFTTMMAFVC